MDCGVTPSDKQGLRESWPNEVVGQAGEVCRITVRGIPRIFKEGMSVSHGPDLDPEFVGGIVLGYIANRTVKRREETSAGRAGGILLEVIRLRNQCMLPSETDLLLRS